MQTQMNEDVCVCNTHRVRKAIHNRTFFCIIIRFFFHRQKALYNVVEHTIRAVRENDVFHFGN